MPLHQPPLSSTNFLLSPPTSFSLLHFLWLCTWTLYSCTGTHQSLYCMIVYMLIRVIQLLSHACMTKHILYMNACRYILNDMCPPLWLWLPSSSTKIYIYNYTCTLQYIEYYRTNIEYSGVRAIIGRRHTSMACCLSYWSQHFIRSYYNN